MLQLIFFGAAMSVFLSLIVLLNKNKLTQEYILVYHFFTIGLALFHFYEGLASHNNYSYEFKILGAIIPLAVNPSLLLYTYSKFGRLHWKNVLHCIPFLFFAVFFLVSYYSNGYQVPLKYGALINRDNFFFYNEIYILSAAFYPTYAFFYLRKNKTKLGDDKWLYYLIIGLIDVFVCGYIFTIILPHIFTSIEFTTEIKITFVAFMLATEVIFMAIYGLKDSAIFSKDSTKVEKYSNSVIEDDVAKDVLNRLNVLMVDDKIYLNSTLKLSDLAEQLSISSQKLSQIVNEYLEKNVQAYLNEYRVNEFKQRLKENGHLTIESIALDSGFNSSSSFYNTFKKVTGETPKQYINRSK